VAARAERKMTKCVDNARWPASAADRNGVGVLLRRLGVRGLGGLSEPVPMQVEFGQEDGVVQGRRADGRADAAGRRHAGA
jgi:hypothetical protein